MAKQFFSVDLHGIPNKKNAPHGYKWRSIAHTPTGVWSDGPNPHEWTPDTQWYPLEAPPIKLAPPPKPEPPYFEVVMHGEWGYVIRPIGNLDGPEILKKAQALTRLDREGVVYGRGWSIIDLPKTGRVLAESKLGVLSVYHVAEMRVSPNGFQRWWPLPENVKKEE